MKRVRRVPNSEVFHLWANQAQFDARNSNDSIFFKDDTIYSYGYHFPMAVIMGNTVIRTTRGYSVTTNSHLSMMRRASSHKDAIDCYDVGGLHKGRHGKHKENLIKMYDEMEVVMKLFVKSRTEHTKDSRAGALNSAVANYRNYIDFFRCKYALSAKMRRLYELGTDSPDFSIENVDKRIEAVKTRAITAQKKAQKKAQVDLDAWLVDESNHYPSAFYDTVRLRVVRRHIGGDYQTVLQTSKHSSIPIKEAKRTFKFIHAIKKRKETWKENGDRFTINKNFNLNLVNDTGIVVACHKIKWDEIERIAKQQNWI